MSKMDNLYASAEELRLPLKRKRYSTVELGETVRLEQEKKREEQDRSGPGKPGTGKRGKALPGLEIDPFLRSEAEVTAFGTLCHHRIEAKLKGEEPGVSLPEELLGRPKEELRKIVETADALVESFISTELGEQTEAGSFESELGFTLRVDPPGEEGQTLFIKGQIDLLLIRDNETMVVDFKTDRYMQPEEHEGQLAVYRAAARELYGLPARSYVVYLRGMRVEEVNREVDISALCGRMGDTT